MILWCVLIRIHISGLLFRGVGGGYIITNPNMRLDFVWPLLGSLATNRALPIAAIHVSTVFDWILFFITKIV